MRRWQGNQSNPSQEFPSTCGNYLQQGLFSKGYNKGSNQHFESIIQPRHIAVAISALHGTREVPRQLPISHDLSSLRLLIKTWQSIRLVPGGCAANSSACSCQNEHLTRVAPCCTIALHTNAAPSFVWRSSEPGFSTIVTATQIYCRSLTRSNADSGTSGCTAGIPCHGSSSSFCTMTCSPKGPFRFKW